MRKELPELTDVAHDSQSGNPKPNLQGLSQTILYVHCFLKSRNKPPLTYLQIPRPQHAHSHFTDHSLSLLPSCISTILSQSAFETGPTPSSYSGKIKSFPSHPIFETGQMMDAVPVPNASKRTPCSNQDTISLMVNCRSCGCSRGMGLVEVDNDEGDDASGTCVPARLRIQSRVTPGRMVPSRAGVMRSISPSLLFRTTKKFICPTSVTLLSSPSNHKIC